MDNTIHDKKSNSIARTNEFGLTEKQESFSRHVSNGLTLKESYERAYDVANMSKASIYSEASRLMDNPTVASRVKTLMEVRRTQTHAIDAMRIRQHVFDRLMIESIEDESPPQARIKALELLGKIDVVSMFKEQKGPLEPIVDDIASLQSKLEQALAKLIDVSPKHG